MPLWTRKAQAFLGQGRCSGCISGRVPGRTLRVSLLTEIWPCRKARAWKSRGPCVGRSGSPHGRCPGGLLAFQLSRAARTTSAATPIMIHSMALLHLPKHRFDKLLGVGLEVKRRDGLVWELQEDFLPPLPVNAGRCPRAFGFVLAPGQPELGPGLLTFEGLEHGGREIYSARAARSSSAERTMRAQEHSIMALATE